MTKSIICGIHYDTEQSTHCGGEIVFEPVAIDYYRTRSGRYFAAGSGGSWSVFATARIRRLHEAPPDCKRYKLTVPLVPPSLNTIMRAHWSAYYDLRQSWRDHIWAGLQGIDTRGVGQVFYAVRVFYKTRRHRDYDNGIFALKLIGDALVDCKVIPSDDTRYFRYPPQLPLISHDARNPRTEIELVLYRENKE